MISPEAEARIRIALAEMNDALGLSSSEAIVDGDTVVVVAPAPRTFPDSFFTDYGKFFDFLRGNPMLGPTLEDGEWKGCEAIIRAFTAYGSPIGDCAYGLATAYLETNSTMQPVRESYWLSLAAAERYATRMYDIKGARPAKARELGNLTPGDGARFMGRGYPQVTGRTNYEKADAECARIGLTKPGDIMAKPDLLLRPDIAAFVMVEGMSKGWFTGRKLSDDIPRSGPATFAQFEASRDIINGKDRQAEIARFAIDFQTGLLRAGYRV